MAKDLFSERAHLYARYRPGYPQALYDYILSFVKERTCAWDCATGNGQAASVLARYFSRVEATDISESQLRNAVQQPAIRYRLSPAEITPFADDSFDLITVATAYHWLNWPGFYKEATRVGKPGCVVAAWAFDLFRCSDENISDIIRRFYFGIISPYWDKERRFVDERYMTVEFPFAPLPESSFELVQHWTKAEMVGYLSTWSAVQHYEKQNGQSPLQLISAALQEAWPGGETKEFCFPLFLRLGRVIK